MHPRYRRRHRDRDHLGHRLGVRNHRLLGRHRHPEHRRDAGNQRLQDVGHLRNHLDDQGHRHQPDDLRHQDHRHQPDVDPLDEECRDEVRPDVPCPVKVRMDCCLDGLPDEEFPCPAMQQMGCCPGEECLGLKCLVLLPELQAQRRLEQPELEPMPLGLLPETQVLQERPLLESGLLEQQALEQQVRLRPLAQP